MYTGLTGKITIDNKTIAYISNWSIEDTADVIEIAKLGGKYKEKQIGQQSWSATADGAVDFTDAGQVALFTAKHNGTQVACEFSLDTAVKFTGTGYIESLSVDLSAEDKGNISIGISGNGKLTAPAAHS